MGANTEKHDANGGNFKDVAGSAYVFSKDHGGSNNWGQVKKIVASDRDAGDYFGDCVSISGDYISVGVPSEDHDVDGNNYLEDAGSAYIFYKDAGGADEWGQFKKIVASNRSSSFDFGESVGMSDDFLAVGCSRGNDTYIFGISAKPVGSNESVSTIEDNNYTFKTDDFTYSEADGDTYAGIKIIVLESKGDLLYNGSNVILNQEIADVTKLTYAIPANENGTPYDTFKFKLIDSKDDLSDSAYTMTINVTPVNDLPTATNNTVTTLEDIDKVFAASEFNYNDIEDSTMHQIQLVSISENGSFFNDANTNGVVDSGEELNTNDTVLKTHIDANRLKFKPALNEFGTSYAHFYFKVHDGSAYSDTVYKMTIDVTSVNDLPTSSDSSFGCPINTDHVIVTSDFQFDDVDGDDMDSVLIVTVPVKGTIYFDDDNSGNVDGGESISNGSFVTVAMLDSGKLKYKPIAGENSQPYTTFTFKVNDGTGSSAATYTMTINVFPEFVVGSIAEDMIICHNSAPNPINGLAPTGGNTPYTYQWQSSSDAVNFTDISGAVNLNYQPGVLTDTTFFRQIQNSNSGCGSRITNTVNIYTLEEFIAGSLSADQTLCYNSTPDLLVGTASTGGKTPYSYQWQSSTDGTTFTDISGEISLNYQPPALTQTTYYRILQTSSSGCGTVATNAVKINIYDEFKAGSIDGFQAMYYRQLPEEFNGIAPTGGTTPYSYQWQQSFDNQNFTDIYGADELDYQAGRLTQTTYFRLKQSSASGCGSEFTNTTTIVVFPEFHVGTIGADQHIVYNSMPEKLTATEPRGGRHPYTYQWQSSVDSINFTDIIGETSLDYQPPLLTETTYYRQIQSSSNGYADKATNIVTIFVYPEFKVGSITESQSVCYNSAPEPILGTEPTGGDLPYSYQWQSAVDGVNFTDIAGATGLDYQPPVLTEMVYYQQVQTSSSDCGSEITNSVVITIQPQPQVDIALDEDLICPNTNYQLAATAQNYESVTWMSFGDGSFNNVNILNPIYTPGTADISSGSVILAINAQGISPCEMQASDQMTLSFYSSPIINAGSDLTIIRNSVIQLNASIMGSGSYSYLWLPEDLVSNSSILNPITNSISETTSLLLQVTDSQTGCVFEDELILTIEPESVTYWVSGKIQSVSLKNSLPVTQVYFTGIDQTTTTDDEGEYFMQVPSGYCGWAIPSRAGYVFEPDSIAFNHVGEDLTEQNYGGELFMRAIATPDSIIAGQQVQLSFELINSSNPIVMCSWQDENGEFCTDEITSVQPTHTTLYSVYVQDEYEQSFDTVRVYVSTTTAIEHLINNHQIKVYPNPAKDIFYLELEGLDADLISVVNTNGILVKQFKFPKLNERLEINLESLIDGNYYILITDSKGELIASEKIIKI